MPSQPAMFKNTGVTSALVAAGLLSAFGYSAVAQTSEPATPSNRPAQTEAPSTRGQLSAQDRQFIMDAAHGGMAEVRLGQLALQRSNNAEVRRFAQQMIQEHSQANQQLMQLATQKGVTPPTTPGPKYEAAMQRLMQLSGENFDRAYMSEAGVNSHLESAAVYQRQAMMGQDPDLKAFAARITPRVQGHLEMAATMTGYRVAQDQDNNSTPARPVMDMTR